MVVFDVLIESKRKKNSKKAFSIGFVSLTVHTAIIAGAVYATLNAGQTDHSVKVRSEEHTSELQSLAYLVCRLLLEKKKKQRLRALARQGRLKKLVASKQTDRARRCGSRSH